MINNQLFNSGHNHESLHT